MVTERKHRGRRRFQDHVKVNFFKGASLGRSAWSLQRRPRGQGEPRHRIYEGDAINKAALKDLVRAAVALNSGKPKAKTPTAPKTHNRG